MSSTFVVGYDGSTCADAALAAAITLGKEMGAKIVVASATTPTRWAARSPTTASARGARAAACSPRHRGGAGRGRRARDRARRGAIPPQALVELAKLREARAIIVGTRGEGPLRGALVGSTPHKLLQLADRPVLVVPE